MKIVISILVTFIINLVAYSGELPIPLDEMQYPNVVQPIFEYKSWGYKLSDLNDAYTCRHTQQGQLLISDFENHALKIFTFSTKELKEIPLSYNGKILKKILPYSASMLEDGNLLVVDRYSKHLLEFDSKGQLIFTYGKDNSDEELLDGGKISFFGKKIAIADTGHNRVLVYSRRGKLDHVIGKYGNQEGEFNNPESLAFDSNGNIFVLDSFNNRVQVFDGEYRLVKAWGQWGSFKSFFANPSDIYISGPENTVYIADLLNHRIQVFDNNGTFKYQFGRHPPSAHEGSGRIHYPTSISVSPYDNSIAVCEPFESRFQIFALANVTKVANVNDSAWWEKATKFHYGSKAASSGNYLAVSEPDTHALLFFSLDGRDTTLAQVIGGQGSDPGHFTKPSGIAIDEKNQFLYISDSGNHRIQKFYINEQAIKAIVKESLSIPKKNENIVGEVLSAKQPPSQAITFVSSYTLNNSSIKSLGNKEIAVDDFEPSALKIGPNGLIYVADPEHNRILVTDKDFQLIKIIGDKSGLNNPLDFSFSKDEKFIFIVDHYNYRVMKFSLNGKLIKVIGGPGSKEGRFVLPFGITSGQDGYLYITDVGGQKVHKFDEYGKHIKSWGRWGTGPGEFYKPKGLTQLIDGTLVVVDFGNHRAQMFDREGNFIKVFGIENAVVKIERP